MIEILKQNANDKGIPILSHEMFVKLTEQFGKDKFRLDLAEYIAKTRPEFPYKLISAKKVVDDFLKLLRKVNAGFVALHHQFELVLDKFAQIGDF